MLKRNIKFAVTCLSSFLLNSTAMAGQGLFLTIHSYLPGASIKLLESHCVEHATNIRLNATTYLEAQNTCLKNWVILSMSLNGSELAKYTLNISFLGSSLSPQGILNKGDKVLVSTLYPHSGISGTQDWVTISLANQEDAWMKNASEQVANKTLEALVLPGTHDSGTQGIKATSEITSDMDPTLRKWINLDPLKIKHLANWSITQQFNIKDQLSLGARYLDLRLCKSSKDEFVTCHGVSGLSLTNVLQQAASFLSGPTHDQELLILDINHLYDINHSDIDKLAAQVRQEFGDKIASSQAFTSTSFVADFWLQKKQIIILIDDAYACSIYPDLFWPQTRISSPWPNRQDPQSLEKALEIELRQPSLNKLFVLQAQETPTAKNIIDGFNPFSHNPDSLFKMTTLYKRQMVEWLARPEIQAQMKAKGGVIIEDFSNGVDLTEYVKKLNG